jgi:hypothetical protein
MEAKAIARIRFRIDEYLATEPVIRGLVPGIHVLAALAALKTWMAGTSSAKTLRALARP